MRGEAGDEAEGGRCQVKEVLLTLSSWRFAPDTDEEPLMSFKQGRARATGRCFRENKNENPITKGKQNYFNSLNRG